MSSCPSCGHRAPRSHGVSALTGSRAAALSGRAGHLALRRSGAQPPGLDRRPGADTRVAMTAGSTAVCAQQIAEGAGRAPGECSGWGRATDRRAGARRAAGGRLCAARADLPGLRQQHLRCVRPRIPGFSPGGLGPHLTSSGSPLRAFLRFPVCPPGSSPSPALLWFPVVRRSPVRLLRPLPGFRFPFGFPPGSLRRATLTLALPRGDSAGVGPGRQGPRSPVPPRPLAWIARSARTTYVSSIHGVLRRGLAGAG